MAHHDGEIARSPMDRMSPRAGELCGLRVEDVDFEHQVALVVGKGGRNRACPFGSKTADALRRHLRVRGRHDAAQTPPFSLGKKGA
jgi:site-specific recombinase XerC